MKRRESNSERGSVRARPSDGDRLFARRFEAGGVDAADFNHRGHLRLAYTYLCEGPSLATARDRMRASIRGFLDLHSVDPAKYHETLTLAWMDAVRHFVGNAGAPDSFEALLKVDDRLLDKEIMLTHYTRKRLCSESARTGYVSPDVSPIPVA